MKVRTDELTGIALDWAVAKCEKAEIQYRPDGELYIAWAYNPANKRYSTNWLEGGLIIEREGIHLRSVRSEGHILNNSWLAKKANGNTGQTEHWYKTLFKSQIAMWYGQTPLIAAMRCYVASKLGDEVDIPEELLK